MLSIPLINSCVQNKVMLNIAEILQAEHYSNNQKINKHNCYVLICLSLLCICLGTGCINLYLPLGLEPYSQKDKMYRSLVQPQDNR